MSRIYRRLLAGTSIAIIGSALALPAVAQTRPAPSEAQADSQPDAGDIVVTARKTAESLLKTPIAVSALSGADLAARDVNTLQDLTKYVPSFTLSNSVTQRNDRSAQSLYVRGVVPVSGPNPATSVFIDGAVVTSGFVEGVSNLARVEVLKGPQGAYFGRAAFAGAVNLVTSDPGNEYHASFDGTFGNYESRNVKVAVEGPIAKDLLSVRLAGRLFSTNGQYRNSDGGRTLGDQATESLAGTLLFTPSSRLKIKLFGLIWRDHDGPTSVEKFRRADYNCNAGLAAAGSLNYVCGTLPAFAEARVGINLPLDEPFLAPVGGQTGTVRSVVLQNSSGVFAKLFPSFLDGYGLARRAYHVHGQIDYDIGDSGYVLTSLTAANDEKREALTNSVQENVNTIPRANSPQGYPATIIDFQVRQKDFSQEVRLTSPADKPLRFLAGVNYTYLVQHSSTTGYFVQPTVAALVNVGDTPTTSQTLGFFGSATYHLTPDLSASIEGRYQIDHIKLRDRFGNVVAPAPLPSETTFRSFQPRAIVQWQATPSDMVYASAAKGVNPGTFNTGVFSLTAAARDALFATGISPVIRPETMYDYELGYKGRFWNNRITLTADVYYALYKNQILSDYVTIPVSPLIVRPLSNAGRTLLKGIEIDATIRPIDRLTIGAQYALNDTNIRSYICGLCKASLTGTTNVAGNQLPSAPRNKASGSLEWRDAFRGDFNWYLRSEYQYHDGFYETVANLARTKASNVFNFRLGVQNAGVSFEVFVLNAFQDKAETSIAYSGDFARVTTGADNAIVAGLPIKRTYGLRAGYKF